MKSKILRILEKNARITTEEIAKMIGEEEASVVAAIAEMEADKVICGYGAIINWDKVTDEKVNAIIEVKVVPQRGSGFDRIANRIAKFDEVSAVYLMSGGNYDFFVEIQSKSMKEVSAFVFNKLSALDSIQSTATHFVLKKYKDNAIILDDEKVDRREMLEI